MAEEFHKGVKESNSNFEFSRFFGFGILWLIRKVNKHNKEQKPDKVKLNVYRDGLNNSQSAHTTRPRAIALYWKKSVRR